MKTEKYWFEIPAHFSFVKLDVFIIMPNHVHGIIIIDKKRNVVGVIGVIVETRHALSLQSPQTTPQTTPPIPPQTPLSYDNLSPGQMINFTNDLQTQ